MRRTSLSHMAAAALLVTVAACSSDGPTTPLDGERAPDTRLTNAVWNPVPASGESGVYVCKISYEGFLRASDPTYDSTLDPVVGLSFDFNVSVDGGNASTFPAVGQAWAPRRGDLCALVYDGDAGVDIAVTEVALPGSALISVFGEYGAFDTGLGGVGAVDLATRTVTFNVQAGVTILYFKNTYEDIPQTGCSLTWGYWKTHSIYGPAPYNPTWALLGNAEDTPFFLSGTTWYGVLQLQPRGNAYYQLAHQYVAAVLSSLNGADVSVISGELATAFTLLSTYTPAQVGTWRGQRGDRPAFISTAGTLASYNEGDIGPGHCDG